MGYGHSLATVDLADGGQKIIDKLPVFDPPELKDIPDLDKSKASTSFNSSVYVVRFGVHIDLDCAIMLTS